MAKVKVREDVPKEPAMVIQDQLILTPGVWNGVPLSDVEIRKGLLNTNWGDTRNSSLYYGHDPKKTENWVGRYVNRRYLTLSDGVDAEGIYADLEIWDVGLASKLAGGKAKFAVSQGMDYIWTRTGPTDIRYNHVGIVYDPGCKNDRVFLNLEDVELQEGKEYHTEIRNQLNLEGEVTTESARGSEIEKYTQQKEKLDLENIQISEKEDDKMNDEKVTNSVTQVPQDKINPEELKNLVNEVLENKAKEVEAEKAKAIEIENKIKSEAEKLAEEKIKSQPTIDTSNYVSKEEFNKILDELKSIKESKIMAPQTVAKPINDGSGSNLSQKELADKLIQGLSR